jgi:hypothetical protein
MIEKLNTEMIFFYKYFKNEINVKNLTSRISLRNLFFEKKLNAENKT